ncbi:LpxL/LpxP family acyltransferase [Marinivivus vitaminiproducens]|uniref:LpxL/LpxP family acyltransferase n=1 Tax=Marinivivus vitaminiproducens TaxID=3035935 RepID=UPI0027A1F5E0|nr:acyltransferase [Geminicoccaceae bacterium SCSIO 64248]
MMRSAWARRGERGNGFVLRLMFWISLDLARAVGRVLLKPIALYFYLTDRPARRASRLFLERALGRPVGRGEVYRHFSTFSAVAFDRAIFLAQRADDYRIDIHGLEHVVARIEAGQGCILLGAHVGSFEVLRKLGRFAPVSVRPLMFRSEAGVLSRMLDDIDPGMRDAVIDIERPEAMLKVRDCLAEGDLVGILGDRIPSGHRFVTMPFLGGQAAFPTGPLLIASLLKAPVLLFSGLWIAEKHYEIRFEPFAESIELRRSRRTEDLAVWVERYAARLETTARAHPFNWFNFYDFWEHPQHAAMRS